MTCYEPHARWSAPWPWCHTSLLDGALFAVTGADEINGGDHLFRSTDLGKTWHDITNNAGGGFKALTPDPDHPGLVRIHSWALRTYTRVADDENYKWRTVPDHVRPTGRRSGDEFPIPGSSI